jgi:SAM-dependent methyltransferase
VSETFGAPYADAYDPLYADKDYDAECDLIESVAARHGISAGTVLDLGCGTGRHAVILASRGWIVTGVDRSEEMLSIARQRARQVGAAGIDFHVGDVRSVRVQKTFDLVLLMFAVLGYQLADSDVAATLDTAAAHLRPGGLVLFDVWNGPAVENIGPSSRSKTAKSNGEVIRRQADGVLDRDRHLCTVVYRIEWIDGETVARSAQEEHTVRYFFEPELRRWASDAGIEIIESGAFPDFDRPIDPTEWNALYVARAPAVLEV